MYTFNVHGTGCITPPLWLWLQLYVFQYALFFCSKTFLNYLIWFWVSFLPCRSLSYLNCTFSIAWTNSPWFIPTKLLISNWVFLVSEKEISQRKNYILIFQFLLGLLTLRNYQKTKSSKLIFSEFSATFPVSSLVNWSLVQPTQRNKVTR